MTTETTFEIQSNQFELGVLESNDIDDLIEVTRQWVKNRFTGEVVEEEISDIRERMLSSLETTDYHYFVVRDANRKAVGCAAIREPEEAMKQYASDLSATTKELVNVFLDGKYRGKGLGYKLMNYVFEKAKELGNTEVIWNSGPRYRDTAWDFYTKLVGKPFDLAKAFYGTNADGTTNDAPVWRKKLA